MPLVLYDVYGPGLYIDNPADDLNFYSQARMSLNILRSRGVGKELIQSINAACRKKGCKVAIEKHITSNAIPTKKVDDAFRARLKQPGNGILVNDAYPLTVRGKKGCSAIVRWNPSNRLQVGPSEFIERPAYLALAHELIHALHFISADCARAPTREFNLKKDSGLAEEEARTVGIGPYMYPRQSDAFCENAIRAAFGQPIKREYARGVDFSQVVRTD